MNKVVLSLIMMLYNHPAVGDGAAFGVNDYFEKQLQVKSNPTRATYYLSCIVFYYRLSEKFAPPQSIDDRLSESEGACLAALTKDVRDAHEATNMRLDPNQAGCFGGYKSFDILHKETHDEETTKKITAMIGRLCIK